MPELPEVETIRRRLESLLEGETIRSVEILDATCLQEGSLEPAVLAGSQIREVSRRGKYLIIRTGEGSLVLHLGMTGRILTASEEANRHRLVIHTSSSSLALHDIRRFGKAWICLQDRPPSSLALLGPEPLDPEFTSERLGEVLSRSRRSVKSLLLDQRAVAGLGNIYVDEALWRAGIHPARKAWSLKPPEVDSLIRAIRFVLTSALESGGTTFSDYRTPDNQTGRYQARLSVYGRKGQPCPRCRQPIERMVEGGRGTHYCPRCQKLQT